MPTIAELIAEKQREQARIDEVIGKLESVLIVMRLWAKEHGGGGQPKKKILEMVEIVLRENGKTMKPRQIAERIREKFDFIAKENTIGTTLHRHVTSGKKVFCKEPGATNTY